MILAPARTCDVCGAWPCTCRREPVAVYVEPTVRIQHCVCGGSVVVYEPTAANIAGAVRAHNATVGHALWRRAVGV